MAEWLKAQDFDAIVAVVRVRFEPRCGRPHFAHTYNGMRVCGRNRTEAREREWVEGTVSSLPGTLNVRIKFCNSSGIARSGGGVRASTTSYNYLVKALIPQICLSKRSNQIYFFKSILNVICPTVASPLAGTKDEKMTKHCMCEPRRAKNEPTRTDRALERGRPRTSRRIGPDRGAVERR